MNYQDAQIGQEVVRSKGDYVVGRTGEIIDRDETKNRVRVAWKGENKTWVSCDSVEPTFIPYEIIRVSADEQDRRIEKTGRPIWPLYRRK